MEVGGRVGLRIVWVKVGWVVEQVGIRTTFVGLEVFAFVKSKFD